VFLYKNEKRPMLLETQYTTISLWESHNTKSNGKLDSRSHSPQVFLELTVYGFLRIFVCDEIGPHAAHLRVGVMRTSDCYWRHGTMLYARFRRDVFPYSDRSRGHARGHLGLSLSSLFLCLRSNYSATCRTTTTSEDHQRRLDNNM